jgi:hypothetical protein
MRCKIIAKILQLNTKIRQLFNLTDFSGLIVRLYFLFLVDFAGFAGATGLLLVGAGVTTGV